MNSGVSQPTLRYFDLLLLQALVGKFDLKSINLDSP
jgi:hypothetical protein